jgi:hypothetical protein
LGGQLPHSAHLEISAYLKFLAESLSLQAGLQSGIIIGLPASQPTAYFEKWNMSAATGWIFPKI